MTWFVIPLQCYIAACTIEMLSYFKLLWNSSDKKKRPRMTKSTIFPRHHIRFPHFTIFFCSILLQSRIINNSLFYILHISTQLVKNETEDRKKEKRKNPLMGLASSFKIEKWLSSALHRSRHKLEVFNCTFPIPFSLPMSLLIDWKYHKIVSPLPLVSALLSIFPIVWASSRLVRGLF